MSKKQTENNVRTITTGHAEADMLGQVYLWLSERTNRKHAQRPHRTYKKTRKYTINELYIRGLFRAAIEWSQTAPTACLRSLKVLKGKGKEIYNRVASHLRKLFVNGK